jgi:hypothetical protein
MREESTGLYERSVLHLSVLVLQVSEAPGRRIDSGIATATAGYAGLAVLV